jgi:hypothetical protein
MSVTATLGEGHDRRHANRELRPCGLAALLVRVQACTRAGPLSDGSPNTPNVERNRRTAALSPASG